MKKKVTQPQLVQVDLTQWKMERGTLSWAHDMAAHAMNTVRQLLGIACMISNAKPGKDAATERQHLLATMELFAANLEQVHENIDEVMVIMEHLEPTLKAAGNS